MDCLLYSAVLSFLLVFALGDAAGTTDHRVNHSKDPVVPNSARTRSHAYFVTLERNNRVVCGGAMVTAYSALTAAHCVQNVGLEGLYIRAGSNPTNPGGTLHRVIKVESHPKWVKHGVVRYSYDIAVLQVDVDFPFGQASRPILMFNAYESIDPKSVASVVGYGIRHRGSNYTKMNYEDMMIVPCSDHVLDNPFTGMFCTGLKTEAPRYMCDRDSEGPVVIGDRLAGIVSRSTGCFHNNFDGINAHIGFFRRWIDSKIVHYSTARYNETQ